MRLTAAALVVVLASSLAACGEDEAKRPDPEPTSAFGKLPVGEVRDAVAVDMRNLTSVHVVGELGDEGFDLRLDVDGNCTGTLTNSGGTAEVIDFPSGHLVRADRGYWDAYVGDAGDQIPDEQLDKWIYTPASLGPFTPACDWQQFIKQLPLGSVEQSKVEADDEIDGEAVVSIADLDGDSTMWVRTSVPHYVVRLEQSGDEAGTLTLDSFDEPVVLPEPDESEVINPGDLSKKAE